MEKNCGRLVSTVFQGQGGKTFTLALSWELQTQMLARIPAYIKYSQFLLIPAKIMFWPLCLERKVWNDPIFWLHNLYKSPEEGSQGKFLWNISFAKKKKEKGSGLHNVISLSVDSSAALSYLEWGNSGVHRPQNKGVEWPQHGFPALTFQHYRQKPSVYYILLPPHVWCWTSSKLRPQGQNSQGLNLHKWPAVKQLCIVQKTPQAWQRKRSPCWLST